MKKLRLLVTDKCNRKCSGCCNNDWDLKSLETCKSFKKYNEVILTGGEPMLNTMRLINLIRKIRKENKKCKIYMYTAKTNTASIYDILKIIDGITVTFHDQSDVENFKFLDKMTSNVTNKSLRLNIFEGIDIHKLDLERWKVKTNIKWIKNCPLPKDEVFMRLD